MDPIPTYSELQERYYTEFAAAYARTELGLGPTTPDRDALAAAHEVGLSIYPFKRSELPRVTRAIGALHGLGPSSLLDVGTGRGAFLWPLLDAFDELPVLCIDLLEEKVRAIESVRLGGIDRVSGLVVDAVSTELDSDSFDVVTVLEVLEHQHSPSSLALEVVRVASRFVVASVPSKEDNNPEHLHLFDEESLRRLFIEAGAHRVSVDWVLGHMVAVISVQPPR